MRDARPKRTLVALALLAGVGASGVAQAQESLTVTVTHYALHGTTYSGEQTRQGVAHVYGKIPSTTYRWPGGASNTPDRGTEGVGFDAY